MFESAVLLSNVYPKNKHNLIILIVVLSNFNTNGRYLNLQNNRLFINKHNLNLHSLNYDLTKYQICSFV